MVTFDQVYAVNDDVIKLKLKKGDSSKNIESVKLVEKTLKTLYMLDGTDSGNGNNAHRYYVAVKTKPMFKDAEFKVSFEVTASTKKEIVAGAAPFYLAATVPSGTTFATGKIGQAWVNNETITGTDLEMLAGLNGRVVKPVKGDDNEVLWTDANRDLAKMVYTADSDVNKYFPKLSTAWNNEFYGMHFDSDAYKMEFVTNPTISATARPVLALYNPFINADGEYTTDAGDLIVYEVVEDELVLASDKFTATTNDDGDQILVTKTRTLGTYVITDAEALAEAPATDVPAEKPVPNTGR